MRKILTLTLVLGGCSSFEQQGFRRSLDGKTDAVGAEAAVLHTPLKGGCPAKMISTNVAQTPAECVSAEGRFRLQIGPRFFTVEEVFIDVDENGQPIGIVIGGGPEPEPRFGESKEI